MVSISCLSKIILHEVYIHVLVNKDLSIDRSIDLDLHNVCTRRRKVSNTHAVNFLTHFKKQKILPCNICEAASVFQKYSSTESKKCQPWRVIY